MSDMNDIITVAVVNFRTIRGENQKNLEKMMGYARAASKQGADLVVFPEMALTGFDDEKDVPRPEKMQTLCAETIPGPSAGQMAELAKSLGIYVVFGMPERDGDDPEIVYNAAAIAMPDGGLLSHRKAHICPPETNWASKGDGAMVFETKWGPIGLGICYEVYRYPELIRYARAKGARLFLNCTAASAKSEPAPQARLALESHVVMNRIFVATANLAGPELTTDFFGGSSIIGPSLAYEPVFYYAGSPFDAEDKTPGIRIATLDLTEADASFYMFQDNPAYGEPDFKPGLYAKLYRELEESPLFNKKAK